jgi:signal peptidase I
MQAEETVASVKTEEEKNDFAELIKAMAIAAVIAVGIRTFLFEPFNIPSGSMFPSLYVGDYLFVEKYAYGYGQYSFPLGLVNFDGRIMESPVERGDVVVFRQPKQVHIDYIKRIIGIPGDRIQVVDGVLYINDKPVQREYLGTEQMEGEERFVVYKKYLETLPNGVKHYIYEISDHESLDDTKVYTVPEGFYFAMGDNRDSSLDSRVTNQVGLVPAKNVIGRAMFLFFSTAGVGDKCKADGVFAMVKSVGCRLVEYPLSIRFNRVFKSVNSL